MEGEGLEQHGDHSYEKPRLCILTLKFSPGDTAEEGKGSLGRVEKSQAEECLL